MFLGCQANVKCFLDVKQSQEKWSIRNSKTTIFDTKAGWLQLENAFIKISLFMLKLHQFRKLIGLKQKVDLETTLIRRIVETKAMDVSNLQQFSTFLPPTQHCACLLLLAGRTKNPIRLF